MHKKKKSYRKDALVLEATQVARDALVGLARQRAVGEHVDAKMVDDRLSLHRFECLEEGYPGWFWEVSVARAPHARDVTVCEVNLIPGPDALLAPEWVPWAERLEPDDVSRTDVLPYDADDPRLQPAFEDVAEKEGDNPLEEVVGAVGYGRPRVLSQHGLDEAAQRWYESERGRTPRTKPKETCGNCGFLIPLSGPLGSLFGVCANEWSPDDGTVVSLDHTCGSHSETDVPALRSQWPSVPARLDDYELEIDHTGAGEVVTLTTEEDRESVEGDD